MTIFKAAAQTTPVSNIFIEKYMPGCKSAIFSVIYIYTLKYAIYGEELSNRDISQSLGILESDVVKAWEYWAEQGIVKLTKDNNNTVIEFLNLSDTVNNEAVSTVETNSPKQAILVKPTYSASDINNFLQDSPELHQFIKGIEKIYAKPFSSSDINTVIGFFKWLGLTQEVVLALFEHCSGKPMQYIEKTACNWADLGIKTYEDAEAYINTYYTKYREIMTAFGLSGRTPIDKEIKYMNEWLYTFKMPIEMIKLACERTIIKTGKPSFDYANGIITDWQKNNITDADKLKAYDIAFKNTKAAKAKKPVLQQNNIKPQQKPTKFVNYNQPTYSQEEIDEAIKRKKKRANNE